MFKRQVIKNQDIFKEIIRDLHNNLKYARYFSHCILFKFNTLDFPLFKYMQWSMLFIVPWSFNMTMAHTLQSFNDDWSLLYKYLHVIISVSFRKNISDKNYTVSTEARVGQ